MIDDDIDFKPARYTLRVAEQLDQAIKYLKNESPEQAVKLGEKFFSIVELLERMPEIGTKYKKGMRKFKLGNFRYNIYYRVKKAEIEIVGIWHTSRGISFED